MFDGLLKTHLKNDFEILQTKLARLNELQMLIRVLNYLQMQTN